MSVVNAFNKKIIAISITNTHGWKAMMLIAFKAGFFRYDIKELNNNLLAILEKITIPTP